MQLRPQITLATPRRDSLYLAGAAVAPTLGQRSILVGDCTVQTTIGYGEVEQVDFYLDDTLVYTDDAAPFTWDVNRIVLGKRTLRVVATDAMGRTSEDYMSVFFLHPLPR
jgi:hypothetical protein